MEQTEYEAGKTRRYIPRAVLIPIIAGTALLTLLLTVLGIGIYLKANGILGLAEMAALIETEYFYYDDRVETGDNLTTAALRGMVSALGDPYARYYTAEEYARQLETDSSEYKGLGIVISGSDETGTPVIAVYPGSTAEAAGLRAGDVLTAINGTATANLTADEVTKLLNLDGTAENEIVYLREGVRGTVSVKAGTVVVPVVLSEMLTADTGYIRITGFRGQATDETKQAIASLREQGMEKLILDLRDNRGGSLPMVLDVADLFLDKGALITSVRSRSGRNVEYKCKKEPIFTGEMCVLVNGNSASASELLTGALKDYGRAHIVGTRTYGKGIVQTTYALPATDGHVKFTTDAYYTPGGVCIQDEGITPDEVVTLPDTWQTGTVDTLPREEDTQLEAALLYLGDA